jgi:hypothetical protein
MKTPGVYIVENNDFPNSVVEVATAVPAFIGYTEKAVKDNRSLLNMPVRISSLQDFTAYFGGAPDYQFELTETAVEGDAASAGVIGTVSAGKKKYTITQKSADYCLFRSLLLFFANGGNTCYIVSVGTYTDEINAEALQNGIDALIKEQEPSMVLIPEAITLPSKGACYSLQQQILEHCGGKMKNRIAILDVYEGYKDFRAAEGDCVKNFREGIGNTYLDFAAAYYPWLNTELISGNELSFKQISNRDVLAACIKEETGLADAAKIDEKGEKFLELLDELSSKSFTADKEALIHRTLIQSSHVYNNILEKIRDYLNRMAPSAAIAGIYAMVDASRGVWKAPANVSLASVVSPTVNISHDEQEYLNLPSDGKAVNAIRSFTGEGVLVWGARTLDGNSHDWRYINVRRTAIMLTESISLASKAYVFEANTVDTWNKIKCMISNFLEGIWKRGGLAGATEEDAFSVHVGLGETMTAKDILENILRIKVMVALTRPKEFIEITFQQHMQKS